MASPSAIGRRAPDGWAEAAARRVLWVGAEGSIDAARSPSPERQPKRGRLDAGGAPGESWRICAVRSPGQAADQHCAAAPAAPAPVAARPAAGTLVSRPDIAAALAELEALAAHYLAEDARLLADDKAALPPSTEASAAVRPVLRALQAPTLCPFDSADRFARDWPSTAVAAPWCGCLR